MLLCSLLALSLSLVPQASAMSRSGGKDGGRSDEPALTIPLDRGRVQVGDIARQVADHLNIENFLPLDDIEWSIDMQSIAGRLQITALERLTGGALDFDIHSDRLDVRVDPPRLEKLLGQAGAKTQRWLAGLAKYEPGRDMSRFGLTFITADDARAQPSALTDDQKQRLVVLVHGLDDPGMMWADFIPALHAAGFTVGRFDYPNDGPISESADLLAGNLRRLRAAGVERIDIIAHSMGGLVVRDMLTRPTYYGGDGSGAKAGGEYPAIDRFIMCGTPNHGANLARLRGLTELREHLLTALAGRQSLRELAATDGSGEAGIDLLPNSEFLRRLNARPLPSHTQCTIIAGRLAPLQGSRMQWLVARARKLAASENAPQWLRKGAASHTAEFLERETDQAINSLGDGCVSIESAQIKGVSDVVIVRASHLGMIIQLRGDADSKNQPPAIPIAIERLIREPLMKM